MAFAVVQALIRARGNSCALVVLNEGDGSIVPEIVPEIVRSKATRRAGDRYLFNTLERSKAINLRRELPPPVFVVVARQLRIRAKIIFFQRKEGVGLGKGARACGKSYHSDIPEKKRYIDFGECVGYYLV